MSFIKVFIIIFALIIFYLLLEKIKRRYQIESWITRKAAHIASGIVAIPLLYFFSYWEFISLLIFFVLFFMTAMYYQWFTSIHLAERVTYGEVFFPLGILAVVFIAYDNRLAAVAAFSILAIPDALAGIIGRRITPKKKTYLGSMVFLLTSIVVLFTVVAVMGAPLTLLNIAILTALAGFFTLVEAFSPYGSDNFTLPLISALVLKLFF